MVLGDDPPLVSVQWTGRGTTRFTYSRGRFSIFMPGRLMSRVWLPTPDF